jgi:uncharacterized protein
MRWLLLALCLPLAAAAMQPFESRELSATAVPSPVGAQSLRDPATLVIIIDDLGNRLAEGEATVNLPGRLSVAVLPHTPHGEHLARQAHRAGKEVLLHAPMSALDQRPPGPGALTTELSEAESRTNKDTVAATVAAEVGLPHLSRQVFLDNVPTREAIAERFAVLVERARRDGLGVAIGHPYPETIAYLQEVLPTLESQGLRLATVSEVLPDLAQEASAQ